MKGVNVVFTQQCHLARSTVRLSQIKDVNFILKHTLIRAITCLVKTPIKMLIPILALQMNNLRFIILPYFLSAVSASLHIHLPSR